jgi:multicomponent Na+:H+ antiporter subunit A
MVLGAIQALGQTDLKRVLAYTTVSALGILVFLIGIGTQMAITAAITFLVVHAMYKGALFLVAGAIDHETGTQGCANAWRARKKVAIYTW